MRIALLLALLSALPLGAQITLLDHKSARSTTAGGTATTPAMNGSSCTSLCFIAVCAGMYLQDPGTTGTLSTSGVTGGTTTHGAAYSTTNHGYTTLFYIYGITSMTSSVTISLARASGTGGYAQVAAAIFSGVAASNPLDQQTGLNSVAAGTAQPGSLTPATNGELGVSCATVQATAGSPTISGSSYSLLDAIPADATVALTTASGYVIQATASAANPTWTFTTLTGNTGGGIFQSFFKPATGSVVRHRALVIQQ